jgi:hypothetical protein
MAPNHDQLARLQLGRCVHHMLPQCATGQKVQHFGHLLLHARALAGHHDHHVHHANQAGAFSGTTVMHIAMDRITAFARLPHIFRALLAMLLIPLLSGCSVVKIAYNNAADLSYWWLDGHMDFNEVQSLTVRADLTALLAWHRANELPLYASTLEKLQRIAPSKVTPDQVCELASEVKTRFQTLLERTEAPVAALAPTFTPEQLAHMARQFDKRNQKWWGQWLDGNASERSARRVKQLSDGAEMLYGSLEEPQLAALRTSTAVSEFTPDAAYREALRRQQDTLQTLRQVQGGSPASSLAQMHALYTRTMNPPDPTYLRYQAHITRETCKALANLHNSITPTQRQNALDTLKSWETDVRALATAGR